MLKKEITYTDFEGKSVTETVYFNMTKSQLHSSGPNGW